MRTQKIIHLTPKSKTGGDAISLGGFYRYKLGKPIKQVLILE